MLTISNYNLKSLIGRSPYIQCWVKYQPLFLPDVKTIRSIDISVNNKPVCSSKILKQYCHYDPNVEYGLNHCVFHLEKYLVLHVLAEQNEPSGNSKIHGISLDEYRVNNKGHIIGNVMSLISPYIQPNVKHSEWDKTIDTIDIKFF